MVLKVSTLWGTSVLGGNSTTAVASGRASIGIIDRAGASDFGGGLFNSGIGTLVNCIFLANVASGGNGEVGRGN